MFWNAKATRAAATELQLHQTLLPARCAKPVTSREHGEQWATKQGCPVEVSCQLKQLLTTPQLWCCGVRKPQAEFPQPLVTGTDAATLLVEDPTTETLVNTWLVHFATKASTFEAAFYRLDRVITRGRSLPMTATLSTYAATDGDDSTVCTA